MTALRSAPKPAKKLPREGTRVAAVIKAWQANPCASRWSDLKRAYDNAEPRLSNFSRNYTGMELSRILKRYGRKVSRGVYRLDERWWDPIKLPVSQPAVKQLKVNMFEPPEGATNPNFHVGDIVEIVSINDDLTDLGYKIGDHVKVTHVDRCSSWEDNLLMFDGSCKSGLTGRFYTWRFKRVPQRDTCQCGYAGALAGKLDHLDGHGFKHTVNGCFMLKVEPPKYSEYLDELEELAISTRTCATDLQSTRVKDLNVGIEDVIVGATQILEVIRAAKKGKW